MTIVLDEQLAISSSMAQAPLVAATPGGHRHRRSGDSLSRRDCCLDTAMGFESESAARRLSDFCVSIALCFPLYVCY